MKNLKSSLLNCEKTFGAWVQIGHPAISEIFARSGFDWVCVDLEHGIIDLETMANIFRAISSFDCTPVARLPLNDPIWIHRCLDAGAQALIIPMVNSAQEAEFAVREAKYPPQGARGFGYSRANNYGRDFDSYIKTANNTIAMIMQIEHINAINNIDEILEVTGVDGVFIGPLDLSGSMDITGQLQHPKMIEALEKYLTSCKKHHKSAGMHIVRPNKENIAKTIEQGYNFIALGVDTVFLDECSKTTLDLAKNI